MRSENPERLTTDEDTSGNDSVRGFLDAPPPALSGRRIGPYRLVLPIAVGGMAQVWTARPVSSGIARPVVIKLVRPEYASDEEYSKMFIDEAMVASAVHHPNVCETYDLGRDGDVLYMVLEWVQGDSLSGLMSVDGVPRPLPIGVAARIVSDACAGLHAAHEAHGSDGHPLGIVHRDVCPQHSDLHARTRQSQRLWHRQGS